METTESLPIGVVIERRRVDHPWKDHDWRPVEVIPGAPALDPRGPWTLLREGEGRAIYHAGTLPLELFRSETEGYKVSLASEPPRLFVVLRRNEDPDIDHEVLPFLVTVNSLEAEQYMAGGDEIVEAVPMPPEVTALVQAFFDAHHVEEVFVKRRRKGSKGKDEPFSRRPPIDPQAPKRSRKGAGEG
jgi:hypothetical protein